MRARPSTAIGSILCPGMVDGPGRAQASPGEDRSCWVEFRSILIQERGPSQAKSNAAAAGAVWMMRILGLIVRAP